MPLHQRAFQLPRGELWGRLTALRHVDVAVQLMHVIRVVRRLHGAARSASVLFAMFTRVQAVEPSTGAPLATESWGVGAVRRGAVRCDAARREAVGRGTAQGDDTARRRRGGAGRCAAWWGDGAAGKQDGSAHGRLGAGGRAAQWGWHGSPGGARESFCWIGAQGGPHNRRTRDGLRAMAAEGRKECVFLCRIQKCRTGARRHSRSAR